MTDREFFQQEYPSTDVLDASRVGGVVYAAFRKRDTGEVVAFVSPVSNGRDGSFVYKCQDETMGPYDARCPARILDLLTEPLNENAAEWRAQCRENLAKSAAAKERAKRVVAGTVIRTAEPLLFSRGGEYTDFRYEGKGSLFTALEDGYPVARVSLGRSWKERDYEIVNPAREALSRAIARAIANGAEPVVERR